MAMRRLLSVISETLKYLRLIEPRDSSPGLPSYPKRESLLPDLFDYVPAIPLFCRILTTTRRFSA